MSVLILNDLSLVGGLEHVLFFHLLGIIIPRDSYFSDGLKPPTSSSVDQHSFFKHLMSDDSYVFSETMRSSSGGLRVTISKPVGGLGSWGPNLPSGSLQRLVTNGR